MAIETTYPAELSDANATLASFVPARLAARLAKPGSEPAQTRLTGAVVFADIVGFTELTERYSHSAEDGLENVSALLNATFARYVDEVHSWGGEVVVFAGDALLAYWPADTVEQLAEVTKAAAACANRMVAAQKRSDGLGSLEVHVGLSAGSLWAARIGGVPVGWQFVLGGSAVREAVAAQASSERGKVIMSSYAAALLDGDRLSSSPAQARRPTPPIATEWPTTTLPRVVRERWARAKGAWLAELRRVTPVFIRIDGLDDSHPDALGQLQRVWEAIQDVVKSFSSERGSLLIDDKGLVFLLVFGIPYNAHADDLLRAVRTALAIERRIEGLGFGCAMGVATGKAFCGVLGGTGRCEYSIVGSAMNRAARLMAVSGRGLLCLDSSDGALDQPDLSLERAGRLKLKGFTEEPDVVRVRAQMAIGDAPRTLCGRAAEQAKLDDLLHQLHGGSGGLVTIVGDAGIGKSALVLDLLDRARQRGIASAHGQSDPEARVSYGAWRNVLTSVLGVGGGDLSGPRLEEALHRSLAIVGRDELLPLLAPILGLAVADTRRTEELRGAARADVTLQLLTDVMRQLAPAPMLVVLEDVHWLDSASWRLVERVTNLVPGLLLVVTSRTADTPGLKDAVANALRSQDMVLAPLDAEARVTLTRELLGGQEPPAELLALVENESAGSPLYIVECVLLLGDALRAARQGGSPEPDSPAHGSARALITSRLDLLSPTQELAVKVASVLGTNFRWTLVDQLLAADSQPSSELPRALVHQRLIAEVPDAPGVFRFSHELIRDVAYGLMLVQQRRALHRDAALAIGADEGGPKPAAILAHHWSVAGDHDQVRVWSERAGTEALDMGAFEEAAQHFTRCLETVERETDTASLVTRLRWNCKLSDAHMGLGNLAERERHARAGLALVGETPDARGSTTRLHALRALAFANLRPKLAHPEAERLEIAALYRHVAHVAYFESDGPGLFVATLRAVHAAEDCEPSPALCASLAELGGAMGIGGMHVLAVRYIERAVTIAERIDRPHGLAYVHMVRCLYLVGRGQWDQALASADHCQRICDTIDDSVTWGNAQIVRFWVAYYRGQLALAENVGADLLNRAQRVGNHQQEAWALRGLALLRLRACEPAAAVSRLEAARQRSSPADVSESMSTFAALGLACWQTGDEKRALALRDEALMLARKVGRPTGHALLAGLVAITELAFAIFDRTSTGRSEVEGALGCLDAHRHVFAVGLPSYYRLRGRWMLKLGRKRAALRLLARGLAAADRLGMTSERELTARQLLAAGQETPAADVTTS